MAIMYNANFIETMPFSDVCAQIALIANTDQSWTVPGIAGTKYQAYFEYNSTSNVFVCKNTAVVLPAANTVEEQQYCEFKPVKRYVVAGDVLYFKTPDAAQYVGVSLRQLPG